MQEFDVTCERVFLKTRQPSISIIAVAAILMIFAFLYPPFLATSFTTEYRTARLFFEGIILLLLALYLLGSGTKIYAFLLSIFCLYMVNVALGVELIQNAWSHFNKLAFLLLLSSVLQRNNRLALALKKIWIKLWACFSIVGVIGYLLVLSNLVNPTILEDYGNYAYYHYPFVGNFFFKSTDLFLIPRYSGFLVEPIVLGLFFGFNMIVAKKLIVDWKQGRRFFVLNMIGGLLTASYAFIIFLAVFILLKLKTVNRLVSHKVIVIICLGVGFIILWMLLGSLPDNINNLLPYSSSGIRVRQHISSINFLTAAPLCTLIFGAGIMPFNEAIGGGASAGIFDVLASRGIILFCIWVTVLYRYARHIPGLFAYILFYSLVLDYWHFPLFILGLAIIASLGKRSKLVC